MATPHADDLIEFDAVLNAIPGNQALSVDFPYNVLEIYGTRGQVKIKATFDGVPYRGSMTKMGKGDCYWLLVCKDIRAQIGKNPGDTVHVTVRRDTEERVVTKPADLAALFAANPEAEALFDKLSYSHQREYVQWIEEAKRPETRDRRLAGTIEMLIKGKKEPR